MNIVLAQKPPSSLIMFSLWPLHNKHLYELLRKDLKTFTGGWHPSCQKTYNLSAASASPHANSQVLCALSKAQITSGSTVFKPKLCFYVGLSHESDAASASLSHTATDRPLKVITNSPSSVSDRQGHLLYIWSAFNAPRVRPKLAQFSLLKKKSKAALSFILPEL